MVIQERYGPIVMGVNEVRTINDDTGVGGFLAVTSGTISVSRQYGGVLTPLLVDFPVSAGAAYGLPIFCGTHGFVVTLAGGASGTLLVQ